MENSEEKNLDVKDTMQDKAYKVIKKCKEIAEKDFTKFSALFVAVMTVGLWVIKGMWYAYQSGRFSVYGIASCYITSDDESFLLQTKASTINNITTLSTVESFIKLIILTLEVMRTMISNSSISTIQNTTDLSFRFQ